MAEPGRPDIPAGDIEDPNAVIQPPSQGDAFFEDYVRTLGDTQGRGQVVTPGDMVLDKGYDSRLNYERIARGNSDLSRQIDYVTNLLAVGEQVAGTQNIQNAERFYGAAIRQADQLFEGVAGEIIQRRPEFQQALQKEQDPVKRHDIMVAAIQAERKDLATRIQQEGDQATKAQLAAYDMDLYTVQRAPGFTRANFGLLLMRNGYYNPNNPNDPALRALREAVAFDKELIPDPTSTDPRRQMGDPNFMRVISDITGMQPGDPNLNRVLQPIFGRDVQLPINGYDPRKPQGSVYDPSLEPGRQPGREGSPEVVEPPRVTDQGGATKYVNGKTPFQRVKELAQLVAQNGLTPDVRNAYEACIRDSSQGTSPRVALLNEQLVGVNDQITKLEGQMAAFEANPPAHIKQLVDAGKRALAAKTPKEREDFEALAVELAKADTDAKRKEIMDRMNKICPEFVKVIEETQKAMKPLMDEIAKLTDQKSAIEGEIIGERNQAAATRLEYGEKLAQSTDPKDKELAKTKLLEAIEKATPQDRALFVASVADIAKRHNIPITEQEATAAAQKGDATAGVQPPTTDGGTRTDTANLSATSQAIDANRKAFDGATDKAKAMTDGLEKKFKDAITAADNDFTSAQARYDELLKQANDIEKNVKPEDKPLMEKFLAEGTSDADRAAAQDQLKVKYPQLFSAIEEMAKLETQGLDLALNRFAARADYARALSMTGRDAEAKPVMEEGFKHLIRDAGAEVAAKVLEDAEVKGLTDKLKIDVQALAKAVESEVPTGPTSTAEGDLAGKSVADLIKIGGYRIKNKDVEGAKKAYDEAIKIIDTNFNAEENKKQIQERQAALESGKLNGKTLTQQERLGIHEELRELFQNAMLAYEVRAGYAEVLKAYGQNKTAEGAYIAAADAAKKLPIAEMQKQKDLVDKEMANVTDETTLASLSDFVTALEGDGDADKGWINTPINAQKDLATFYVRLIVDEDPDTGRPRLNEDGTPKFRADPSEVFDPAKGLAAVDEAKRLMKEIRGVDLDVKSDPTLATLANALYENSPAELQRKYANVSKFWHDAVADTGAGLAGILVTAGLMLASRKVPFLRPIAQKSPTLFKTGAVALGVTTSIGTRHAVMTGIYDRKDETLQRSIVHGGASYLSAVMIGKGGNTIANKWTARAFTHEASMAKMAQVAGSEEKAFALLKATSKVADDVPNLAAWSQKATSAQRMHAVHEVMSQAAKHEEILGLASKVSNEAGRMTSLKTVVENPDLISKLTARGLNVAEVGGQQRVTISTVGDLRKYLHALKEADASSVLAKQADDVFASFAKSSDDELLGAAMKKIADGPASEWGKLSFIKQLAPEAFPSATTAGGGRFAGVRKFAGDMAAANGFRGKAGVAGDRLFLQPGKSVLNGAWNLVGRPGGAGANLENMTSFSIGTRRWLTGSAAVASGSAAYNYSTAWNYKFLEGNIDPKTGKPYEFNFKTAFQEPFGDGLYDNIFTQSLLLGPLARPGMLAATAPFEGGAWQKAKGIGGLLTGTTPQYYGARSSEALGAAATYWAVRQWGDVVTNVSNIGAGKEYQELLDAAGRAPTDKDLKGGPQPQPQPGPEKRDLPPEKQEVQPPVEENKDLTGGAPQ